MCSKGCSKGAARVCSKGAARVCSRGSGRLLEVGLAQLVRPVQQRLAHHGAHARVVVRLAAGAPHRQIERIYQSVRPSVTTTPLPTAGYTYIYRRITQVSMYSTYPCIGARLAVAQALGDEVLLPSPLVATHAVPLRHLPLVLAPGYA